MLEYLAIALASFTSTFLTTKYLIRKFKKKGIVVVDYYKKGRPKVPWMGGLAILFGIITGIILSQFLLPSVEKLLIFYFIVISYALFTLVDDLVDIGRKIKIIVPFFLAMPIALLNIDTSLSLYFFQIELGAIYTYLIAPLYLMVVANLINMHSGFNGLSCGLSIILMIGIAMKVLITYGLDQVYYLIPALASTLAFFYFNRYPSRIFLGNVGSYLLGSTIGGLLILYNMEFFGVIILIPHIINFLMFVYSEWVKGIIKRTTIVAKLRDDGTIEPPAYLTMKWFPAYFFKLKEWQCVLINYAITIAFVTLALALNL